MLMLLECLPVILVSLRKPEYNMGKKEGEALMSLHAFQRQGAPSSDEMEVRTLYQQLLDGWNQHNAAAFAAPFAEDGEVIGFDGSQMTGRVDITATLGQIFADHVTAPYVSKVKCIASSTAPIAPR